MTIRKIGFLVLLLVAVGCTEQPPSSETPSSVVEDVGGADVGVILDAADGGGDVEDDACQSVPCDGGSCVQCFGLERVEVEGQRNVRPDGLNPEVRVHFEFDDNAPDTRVPLDGQTDSVIIQRVTQGRVELLLQNASGAVETLAPPGWNLMPMATFDPIPGYVACWVRLTGQPTEASAGDLPDPRTGASPVCRTSANGTVWSRELVLPHQTTAAWLVDVRSRSADGAFLVTIYEDVHGTLINEWDVSRIMTYPILEDTLGEGYADPSALGK